MEKKKLVIGITGTIASGKDTVGGILRAKGCNHIVLSSIIREEVAARNMDPTRKNLQDVGNDLRKQFGGQVLAERALNKFKSYDAMLVIDGIRNIDEINFLRANANFFLIGVDAPFEIRWNRVKSRNRDSDLLNHDRFAVDDARDRGFNEPLNGQQVSMCLVQADFLVNNDEEFKRLEDSKLSKEVNDIYRKIMKTPTR